MDRFGSLVNVGTGRLHVTGIFGKRCEPEFRDHVFIKDQVQKAISCVKNLCQELVDVKQRGDLVRQDIREKNLDIHVNLPDGIGLPALGGPIAAALLAVVLGKPVEPGTAVGGVSLGV